MKLKFKLIPFIISILIIVISVTGVTIYAYKGYDTNKIRFVNDYFHYSDHSKVETLDEIESYNRFASAYYRKAGDEFTFNDIKSDYVYNETPSQNSKNFIDGATYKDGILHLDGWFDIIPYAVSTYNSDTNAWVYTYYFYVFNVNYRYQSLIRNLNFCFVNGIGNDESEFVGTYKLNTVIDEIKSGTYLGANGTNLPTYKFKSSRTDADGNPVIESESMYIYDDKAKGEFCPKGAYVYRLTAMSETLSDTDKETYTGERRWLSQLENATFSIYYTGEDSTATKPDNFVEIVRGTFTRKYENVETFNNLSKANNDVAEGAQSDLFKAGYGAYIAKRIIITGLITFAISGVLAFLFYLIWQDDVKKEPKQKKEEKKKLQFK